MSTIRRFVVLVLPRVSMAMFYCRVMTEDLRMRAWERAAVLRGRRPKFARCTTSLPASMRVTAQAPQEEAALTSCCCPRDASQKPRPDDVCPAISSLKRSMFAAVGPFYSGVSRDE